MAHLNVPIELIKRYKESKARKELLAFAIGIKCLYSNSVLTEVSAVKVMKLFHVSHSRANRLIEEAKNSSLFSFDPTFNQLRVNTFKDKSYKVSKTGVRYISDYCYKLDVKEYSIGELCHTLTKILMLNAIHAVQLDKLLKSGNKVIERPCAYSKGLNLRKLASIAGVSLATASRTINEMWKCNQIERTRCHATLVISSVNEYTIEEWKKKSGGRKFFCNPKDNTGWLFMPAEYTLKDSSPRFVHVIYDHNKRRTCNECKYMSEIDRLYSTIHAF